MTTQTNDALASAIAALGAKDLGEGRYAVQSSGFVGRWYTTTAATLRDCAEKGRDLFASTATLPLPSWWTPKQRFAIAAQGNPLRETFADLETAEAFRDLNYASLDRIVTADYETGEEVLC